MILDSGSSIDIFRNPQLVTDSKRSDQVLRLSTDVGSKTKQIQAVVPDYGKFWYEDKSIANIFSLNNLVKKYRVTYDSHQDGSFTVHTNIGIIQFIRNKQGLYVFKTTYNTEISNVVTTVEENIVGFTSRQIERAELARNFYSNVGIPTVKNFNNMLSTNMVSNFPISIACRIYKQC